MPGRTRPLLLLLALLLVAGGGPSRAEDGETGPRRRGGAGMGGEAPPAGSKGGPPWVFRTDVPAHDLDVVLGRPARDSVVVSLRALSDAEGCVEWRAVEGTSPRRTAVVPLPAKTAVEVRIDGLAPDTAYEARALTRRTPSADLVRSEPVWFRTQRPPGASFAFTVQADSHLDNATDPALYARTLANVADARPDFHVDLGDTFMTDKYRDDFRASLAQYEAQRWYFGLARVPVLLVLGNHDGEVGWRDQGRADDMPHWSNTQRRRLFPNPEPDAFYSGPASKDALNGHLESAFAWAWGDALFVVLDPFWPTRTRKGRDSDPWTWTLGEEQTRWLARTLEASRASYRFVFIHHLVGGSGAEARGGAEVAGLYEWGGRSPDGTEAFAERRPGWPGPVHSLLAKAGPTVVFHGHDHFYARQEKDGVVYQMVPQPGHPGGDARKMAEEYGYTTGDFLPSPGYLRVRVAPKGATVEYVGSSLKDPAQNGRVVRSWDLKARGG